MPKGPNNRSGGKKRHMVHKRLARHKFLKKGDDQVFDALQQQAAAELAGVDVPAAELDEDLPGMGQWRCTICDRYFASKTIQEEHNKSKFHKRRAREFAKGVKPHDQEDAEVAAGMGKTDNGPPLRSGQQAVDMAY
eukprot:TRINITY_DN31963_c0_g1_i2.p1 TRINITY_DN31963_c0_g1~~TRINITY_DN31963_c0_g1_i2.p1  ORF type:complete len:136 (+),score=16.47 TRINITY_DN31963_c0_g1_i2:403-810(+)